MVDPPIPKDTREALDSIYSRLLESYKGKAYQEYTAEAAAARADIGALQPPAPTVFRPYPKVTDAAFNEKLAAKQEFARYSLPPPPSHDHSYEDLSLQRCNPTDFKLTSNQKFVKNFMSPLTPYRGLLLFHSVGVGKTCTAISIAEQYLAQPNAKRVLVILSSNIKDNFKKQIFDMTRYDMKTGESSLCTGTRYPDMIMDKAVITKDLLDKRISRLIKERYQFVGYKELVVMTNKIMEQVKRNEKNPAKHEQRYEEKVRELFSNRLMIVDEAHNLRMPSETGKKQIAATLLNILKIAQDTRLVLMTATPMFNSANEIVWMMNLLLTNDKRPTIATKDLFSAKTGQLTQAGQKMLAKAARGYVSYMRGENPFTFPFRLYPSINKDPRAITRFPTHDASGHRIPAEDAIKHLELVGSPMSTFQKKIYQKMKEAGSDSDSNANSNANTNDEEATDGSLEDDSSTDLQNTLQLSNIAYPSRNPETVKQHYGSTGFNEVFDRAAAGVRRYKPAIVKEFGEVLSYGRIADYSPKIKSIIDYIINSTGIVFVYSQYYYSGIIPLAIALEHIGFVKHGGKNIAAGISVEDRAPRTATGKRPSYIIVSRDKDLSPNNDREIAEAKSRANRDGEVIKVVIVSKVGTEGIDFKRIREVHIMEPWFNLNRTEQIIGRAVRTCSHIDLPPAERNVTVYLHAATYTDKEESVDLRTYRNAERKQRQISAVQRVLKETSIDCSLNIDGLFYPVDKLNKSIDITTSQGTRVKGFRIGDRDNSAICDYGKCAMACTPEVPAHKKGTDATTFDPMFVVDDIDMYKKYISRAFYAVAENTFDEVMYLLKDLYGDDIEEDIVAYALQEMVDTQYKFRNSEGRYGYLIYRGTSYIFQDAKVYETKLSMEERRAHVHGRRLEFDALAAHRPSPPSPDAPTHTGTDVVTDTDAVTGTDAIAVAIFDKAAATFKALSDLLDANKYKVYILGYIVDRMSLEDTKAVLKAGPQSSKDQIGLYDAIIASGAVLEHRGQPRYYYSHHDDSFYSIPELARVGPLELAKVSKEVDAMKARLVAPMGYRGFIEVSKKGETVFKMRDDPKARGYVCYQTSSLTTEELKRRIVEARGPTPEKVPKRTLCDIYEVLLRSRGPQAFRRPIHIKI